MSETESADIVNYSTTEDGARVKEAIQATLADKIINKMETKKAEIAQSMFNSAINSKTEVDNDTES